MKQCLAEGELRAYLDGELGAPEMERAAAHLAGCETCDAAVKELGARAERVSALLGELESDDAAPRRECIPAVPVYAGQGRPPGRKALWITAGAALAAGLAAIYLLAPDRAGRPGPPAAPVRPTPTVAAVAPPAPVPPAPDPEPVPRTAAVRSVPIRSRRAARRPKPEIDYFLALDDEPIDRGTVVRVKLGPAEVPADVVFDPEGRPRAIRLASY